MNEVTELWVHIRDSNCCRYITDVSNLGNLKYGDGRIVPSTLRQRVMIGRKVVSVSHFVAERFVSRSPEDIALDRILVDHKTHKPVGIGVNDYRNLRWCTHRENSNFSECIQNIHDNTRGKARSIFGKWFNSVFPRGHYYHVNEYAYYFRQYRDTGALPTVLDYSGTFKGRKSEFSRWFNTKYGAGSANPSFYQKCRRHYLKTGEFLEV